MIDERPGNDSERIVSFSYSVRDAVGYCHRFKIRVAHISNLPEGNAPPLDSDDLAEAYWLAYLNLPSDQNVPIDDCFFRQETKEGTKP